MGTKALLEALLFLSGQALTPRQLAQMADVDVTTVKRLLTLLAHEYRERDGGLELARRGRRWVLQVRPAYAARTRAMAPTTLSPSLLKTASLIAYHQPVKQSHLVRLLGSATYDHVRQLREIGLIAARPDGRTLLLSTTSKFLDHFGLDVGDREELRDLMARRLRGEEASGEAGVSTA